MTSEPDLAPPKIDMAGCKGPGGLCDTDEECCSDFVNASHPECRNTCRHEPAGVGICSPC